MALGIVWLKRGDMRYFRVFASAMIVFSTFNYLYAENLDPGSVEDKLLYYAYHNYEINITSRPSGARVYIDEEFVGQTPVTYYVDGKVSKFDRIIIETRSSLENKFVKPQTFAVERFSIIPRHIHFDMLKLK